MEKQELKKDRVYRIIRSRLTEMTENGGRFPSEPELSRELKVSRATLRSALDRLEKEGRIIRSHYYGTRPAADGRERRILLVGESLFSGSNNMQRIVGMYVAQVAAEHGFRCDEVASSFLREPDVLSRRYRGIIFFGAGLDGSEAFLGVLRKCTVPVVYCREDYENGIAGFFPSVGADNKRAWTAGLEYLVSCGCRRILTLLTLPDERNRIRLGWDSASLAEKMRSMGLAEAAGMIRCVGAEGPELFGALDEILRTERVDAVQCYSDGHAMWIYDSAQRVGRKIPQDMMVLGYDGFPGGDLVRPTLASLEYPCEQCARAALWLILHAGENEKMQHVVLPMLIRPGGSIRSVGVPGLVGKK